MEGDNKPLSLYDNQYGEYKADITGKLSSSQIELLRRYSGCTLSELEKLGIQALGTEAKYIDHVAEDTWVYRLVERESVTFIETGNTMGVLRVKNHITGVNVLIQIKSRFDKGNCQYFLVYLLTRMFGGVFLREMDIPAEGPDMWDFLIALLLRKQLISACQTGLYREYQENYNNDLRYRGKFDLDTHMKRNIPFIGSIAYTIRDISFDNPLNHLIRHALAKIKTKWAWLLADGYELTKLMHLFEQSTPTWQSNNVWTCVHNRKNRISVKHPLYATHYEPLRILSRALLHEEGANPYSNSENEIEGFLFDGAWLWEEYLNTILEPLGFKHPRNKDKTGALSYFSNGVGTIYPDFWKTGIVADAKYKRLHRGIGSDDLSQIISYMHVLDNIKDGYFLYPKETDTIERSNQPECIGTLNGFGGNVFTLGLKIPESTENFQTFSAGMMEQEESFKEILKGEAE